jgi:Ca2+-binding RTX toxin-like protein
MADYTGTPSFDSVFGGGADESFDYSQGGPDTVWGGGGDDTIYMGAALGAGDQINGEGGLDVLQLEGDYSAGLTLDSSMVVNVETIHFLNFSQVRLTLTDGMVSAGETLAIINDNPVDASVIDGGQLLSTALDIDLNGTFYQFVRGGALDDTVTLENGVDRTDVFDLGAGDDTLNCQGIFLRAAGHNFRNIETINFADDARLTLNDGNVAAGETLTLTTSSAGSSLTGIRERDGHLHMIGDIGIDGFYGGWQGDTLEGGGGADTLYGARGADQLSGGAGADSFVYNGYLQSVRGGADVITDLDDNDTIELNHMDADFTQGGQQAFTLVEHFHRHAGELTFGYNALTGYTRLAGDIDGDGKADFVIQILGDHSDFNGLEL